jgi:UDP-N-acetylglucosamine diphosphorylase / glucose-1-phosphate thymidylyltransferase / UDP-N-acetylgalactosamine diphosphorylase / glucosamine-1-phosphate N-acetyltransferase / galactosamine-1-phosphate N-acetyltransferase
MKALILAGGRGTRLDELSFNNNKCMVRVLDRPVIEYCLDCVVGTDIEDIIIVIGYRAEDIINHLGNNYKGKRIKYVIQAEQEGLVHALECARDALAGEDFMLLLGDEILINPRHREMIDLFNTNDLFGICGILRVVDINLIKRTYCLIQDENNTIFRLIEKPRKPLNNFMGTGDCIFRNQILQYIEYTPIHHERKEKELPDLIQCAIDDGNAVKSFIICDKYTNINTKEDITMAESFFRQQ